VSRSTYWAAAHFIATNHEYSRIKDFRTGSNPILLVMSTGSAVSLASVSATHKNTHCAIYLYRNMVQQLSPEQQNARMSAERAVLTSLLQAAVAGDFGTLQSVTLNYIRDHNQDDDDTQQQQQAKKSHKRPSPKLSVADVLTQFKDAQKRNALHFACQSKASSNSSSDIVELILDWLPSEAMSKVLRCKDAQGLTPLMMAAQCYDVATAERRVEAILQADARCSSSSSSSSATTAAAASKLGLGRSKAGATALHYAAAQGATARTIDALIGAGHVALHTFSLRGGTPLHWACSMPPPTNHTATIQALIRHGANVNATNETIPPPLALALAAGHAEHAKCLLESTSKDNNIETSVTFILQPGNVSMFHMAADMNLASVLLLLLEQCPNVSSATDLVNDEGYTALDLAAKQQHIACVMVLLSAVRGGDDDRVVTEDDAREFINHWKAKPDGVAATNDAPLKLDASQQNESKQNEDAIESAAKQLAASLQQANSLPTDEQLEVAKQHKERGNAHYAQKEWSLAVDEYSAAIAIHPLDATYYSNRSAAHLALQQLDSALSDAVVARCLDPTWPKAAFRMAVARLALGRYEDAALAAWEGLQQDPDNEELQRLLQKCVKKGRQDFQESKKKAASS
jgi:ankyrin repeat protein